MLTVIGRGNSANVQKVLWYLSEMGIVFTREDFAGHPDGRRAAALLRLNPNGLVPILIDGEFAVWESNTILRYIANKFGPSAWYSPDARQRALADRWMDWQLGTLNSAMTPLFIGLVRTLPEKRDYSDIAVLRSRAEDLFSLLDVELAHKTYLAGKEPTLADVACGVFAHRWFQLSAQNSAETPHLKRWYDVLSQRPEFRQQVMVGLT
jgi:glutathione S-transferase